MVAHPRSFLFSIVRDLSPDLDYLYLLHSSSSEKIKNIEFKRQNIQMNQKPIQTQT